MEAASTGRSSGSAASTSLNEAVRGWISGGKSGVTFGVSSLPRTRWSRTVTPDGPSATAGAGGRAVRHGPGTHPRPSAGLMFVCYIVLLGVITYHLTTHVTTPKR